MKQIITILFLCVCVLDIFGRNNSGFAVESNLSGSEAFQSLYIDSVPLIFIEAPLDQSVATPFLPVKAWCQDSSGCRLRISINSPFDTASINFDTGNMVDTVLDLSGFNNLGVVFSIEAISLGGDSANFSQWRNIYVDASPSLKQVFAGSDQIFDFNYNKILVTSPYSVSANPSNPYIHRSRIVDIFTGDSTIIPNENYLVSGYLSRYGAVFNALISDTIPQSFNMSAYDWNNGSVYQLGQATPSETLQISGDYTIWATGSGLYIRNLQTLQNSFISSSVFDPSDNSVTSNGVVTYAYADPSKQPIIYVHPPGLFPPDSLVAIPDPNVNPNTNIYGYSNNISTPVTNDSYKYNYGPLTDGKRFLYAGLDTCCEGFNPSAEYHIRVSNGQTDSAISDVGIEPPFPIRQYQIANGFIAFTKADSAGHLQIWLMDSLGKSSQITFSGNFNTIELLNDRGDMIFTSAIDVPNYGVVTKRFFANRATKQIRELCSGNGRAFYRDSTWYVVMGRMLYSIDIVGSPVVIPEAGPIISGLDSSYCKNQGMQKIKILNLPDTTKGTSVRVLLDSTTLAIAPDSSFSFTPSNLSAGAHVIKVLYNYSDNTQVLGKTFNIRDLAKPDLTLSVNTGIVTSSSAPVIITATNKSGGGTSPTYTFAKDRNLINILQPEGTSNFLNIDPTSLNMGVNQIYVRMKTSDSCYAFQTNTDSIQIVKNSTTGIIDLDFPNQTITNFPNPSSQYMTITGINSSKTYLFIIRNELGENVNQVQVGSANTTNLYIGNLKSDNYWLTVFDYNKNKLIGTIPFIKY